MYYEEIIMTKSYKQLLKKTEYNLNFMKLNFFVFASFHIWNFCKNKKTLSHLGGGWNDTLIQVLCEHLQTDIVGKHKGSSILKHSFKKRK